MMFMAVTNQLSRVERSLAEIEPMVGRFNEIQSAHEAYEFEVKGAKEAAGYFELERSVDEALAEDNRLRRELALTPALTVRGLIAKLSVVADSFGLESLEDRTTVEDGETVTLDQAALSVPRDGARMDPSLLKSYVPEGVRA
jgi:hypothetical protein